MPFRVIVTGPDGELSQTQADTLPNRAAAGMSALRYLSSKGVAFGLAGNGLSFGRAVRDAPLGEPLTHDSGYIFRTEEF